jgi:hypothetical protein
MAYIDILLSDLASHIAEGTAYKKIREINSYGLNFKRESKMYTRMAVLDVIFDPNDIATNIDDYSAFYQGMGVSNINYLSVLPRNSIVAIPVGEINASIPLFLIPFFPPHFAMPVKPGEQIWAFFEDEDVEIGYWVCRVNDFQHVDDVNHTHAPRLFDKSLVLPGSSESANPEYEFRNGVVSSDPDGERYTLPQTAYLPGGDDSFEKLLTLTRSSRITDYESVPRFRKRPADYSLEGSNNQLIAMTTDRSGPVAVYDTAETLDPDIPDDDLRTKSGAIDIVVGRGVTPETSGEIVSNSLEREELAKALTQTTLNEGDPDWKNDKSRIVIVQKSGKLIDGRLNAQVEAYVESTRANNSTLTDEGDGEEEVSMSGAAIKSDKVRIVARSDVVIVSTNYEVDENGNVVDVENIDELASVVLRPGGDIIIKPGINGVVKIGGEDADRAILCTSEHSSVTEGEVDSPGAMISTMGGHVGTGTPQQGTFSTKVLVKA